MKRLYAVILLCILILPTSSSPDQIEILAFGVSTSVITNVYSFGASVEITQVNGTSVQITLWGMSANFNVSSLSSLIFYLGTSVGMMNSSSVPYISWHWEFGSEGPSSRDDLYTVVEVEFADLAGYSFSPYVEELDGA